MTASLCDILPSVGAVLGVPDAEDVLDLRGRSDARRVLVMLVDGLGLHLLPELAPHAPLLASVLAGTTGSLTPLESTFPSTTPQPRLVRHRGEAGEHGVLGFTVNVPGSDRVLTHILWRDDPPPGVWQPVPTWFERCTAAGVPAVVVLPAEFRRSGLTRAAYRGARFAGLPAGEDAAERVVHEVHRIESGLVYGYTPVLDTAAHVHGIASAQWQRAAGDVDALLTRIVERLPDDALLIVTADHGGLDLGPEGRLDLADHPELRAGLRVMAGEPRVRYLHTVDGAGDDVLAAWRDRLGGRALVQPRDEVVDAGWFGPVADAHRDRIGDVVVICRGDTAIFDSDVEPPEVSALVGLHGADSPVETAIPLITIGPGGRRVEP